MDNVNKKSKMENIVNMTNEPITIPNDEKKYKCDNCGGMIYTGVTHTCSK